MTTALIVFAKAPVAGLAKTRLAAALGGAGAAALAARMLRHALAQAVAAGIGPVELCGTPDELHPALRDEALRCGATLTAQGGGDLGARMQRAIARALTQHDRALTQHDSVLLMGSDAPALDAALLRSAALRLRDHDAVFVPALDGGYVLVGQRRADERCFAAIPWGTPEVMAATRLRLRQAGTSWAELPAVADIDVPGDLRHLPADWLLSAPDEGAADGRDGCAVLRVKTQRPAR